MLGKLMKYEWKAIWRILLIINAFTFFVTLLGMLAMHLTVNDKTSLLSDDVLGIIVVLIFMLYYATIIGVSFAIIIYSGIRFYKNLYTDEGYLMHTLPVTKWQLIVSKLTIHSVAVLITQLLVLCSIGALFLPLLSVLLEDPTISFRYMWNEFVTFCNSELNFSIGGFLFIFILATVVGTLNGVLTLYCSISLGQTFHKHKVMGSILCYVGIYFFMQTFNTILMMPQMILHLRMDGMEAELNFGSYMNGIMLTTTISCLITGIIFYFITSYMMSKKLNLD